LRVIVQLGAGGTKWRCISWIWDICLFYDKVPRWGRLQMEIV